MVEVSLGIRTIRRRFPKEMTLNWDLIARRSRPGRWCGRESSCRQDGMYTTGDSKEPGTKLPFIFTDCALLN